MIYLAEVDPKSRADVIIDNRDFKRPRIMTAATLDRRNHS